MKVNEKEVLNEYLHNIYSKHMTNEQIINSIKENAKKRICKKAYSEKDYLKRFNFLTKSRKKTKTISFIF